MEKVTENCISQILSFTSPFDTCRASAVSKEFHSAADSDQLWNNFLPSHISQILTRSLSTLNYTTKRHLYFLLCDSPILLDDGNLSFSLDKKSGKKCFMVAARQLSISWGDNPNYWSWYPNYNSRFSEVAVLKHVWWLDIRGKIKTGMLSPHTTYETYLVFKMKHILYSNYMRMPTDFIQLRHRLDLLMKERMCLLMKLAQFILIQEHLHTTLSEMERLVRGGRTNGWRLRQESLRLVQEMMTRWRRDLCRLKDKSRVVLSFKVSSLGLNNLWQLFSVYLLACFIS